MDDGGIFFNNWIGLDWSLFCNFLAFGLDFHVNSFGSKLSFVYIMVMDGSLID